MITRVTVLELCSFKHEAASWGLHVSNTSICIKKWFMESYRMSAGVTWRLSLESFGRESWARNDGAVDKIGMLFDMYILRWMDVCNCQRATSHCHAGRLFRSRTVRRRNRVPSERSRVPSICTVLSMSALKFHSALGHSKPDLCKSKPFLN